jgi:hypothetical protein
MIPDNLNRKNIFGIIKNGKTTGTVYLLKDNVEISNNSHYIETINKNYNPKFILLFFY